MDTPPSSNLPPFESTQKRSACRTSAATVRSLRAARRPTPSARSSSTDAFRNLTTRTLASGTATGQARYRYGPSSEVGERGSGGVIHKARRGEKNFSVEPQRTKAAPAPGLEPAGPHAELLEPLGSVGSARMVRARSADVAWIEGSWCDRLVCS
jgi:hypothetical protein